MIYSFLIQFNFFFRLCAERVFFRFLFYLFIYFAKFGHGTLIIWLFPEGRVLGSRIFELVCLYFSLLLGSNHDMNEMILNRRPVIKSFISLVVFSSDIIQLHPGFAARAIFVFGDWRPSVTLISGSLQLALSHHLILFFFPIQKLFLNFSPQFVFQNHF